MSRDEPDGLDELLSRAIRIDNRLREHRRERAGKVACPISTSASFRCSPSPTASLPKAESALGAAYTVARLVTLSPLYPCYQQKGWLGSSGGYTVEPNHWPFSPQNPA
jgi:hypothetical protein